MNSVIAHSLISDFYAAAAGRTEWRQSLENLATALGLWGAQIVGVDKRKGSLIFSAEGGPAPPQAALDYIRSYHAINPRVALTLNTPHGQWMHCHEHIDAASVASSVFYQDFLIPHGGRYLTATKLIDDSETVFMVGLMRGQGAIPFAAADSPILGLIQHHLSEALRNFVHLRATYAELGMARALLDQFSYPMILIDEMRGVLHRNDAAIQILDQREVVFEEGGYLMCRHREDDASLTEAIHELQLVAAPALQRSARRAVALRKLDGSRYLAFISLLQPDQTMGAFGDAARVLIVFYDPGKIESRLDPFILAECFDFTPAEARVAAQIANGDSPKEIAKRSGAALATVRSQLQRVMEKTGVARQAELVGLLLGLPSRA